MKERCSSQKHFIDLCRLLKERTRIDDSLSGTGNQLRDRTLAKIYNQRPTWLDNAHKKLARAVLHAYGWDDFDARRVEGQQDVPSIP